MSSKTIKLVRRLLKKLSFKTRRSLLTLLPIAIFTGNTTSSTKYEDGVTYSDTSNKYTTNGNNLDFTPPHDAPSTLYYICINHSGMGW